METKTQFGLNSITKHPPKWLVPTFAASIAIIGVASFIVTGDPGIGDELKLRINHYLTGLTMLISALAPLFGVDIKTN
jgi:hypothetical protein